MRRKPYYLTGIQENTILIVKAVLGEIKEKQNWKFCVDKYSKKPCSPHSKQPPSIRLCHNKHVVTLVVRSVQTS